MKDAVPGAVMAASVDIVIDKWKHVFMPSVFNK